MPRSFTFGDGVALAVVFGTAGLGLGSLAFCTPRYRPSAPPPEVARTHTPQVIVLQCPAFAVILQPHDVASIDDAKEAARERFPECEER